MKGDAVSVVIEGLAAPLTIVASKAGRTVTVTKGTKWVSIVERTAPSHRSPNGRPTGNSLSLRTDAVLSIHEMRGEPEPLPRKARAKVPATVPLGLVADG